MNTVIAPHTGLVETPRPDARPSAFVLRGRITA
jgi:hypothetical protein